LYRHYEWHSLNASLLNLYEEIKHANAELRHIRDDLARADGVPWITTNRTDLIASTLLGADKSLIVILVRETESSEEKSAPEAGDRTDLTIALPASLDATGIHCLTPDGLVPLDAHTLERGASGTSDVTLPVPKAARAYVIDMRRTSK